MTLQPRTKRPSARSRNEPPITHQTAARLSPTLQGLSRYGLLPAGNIAFSAPDSGSNSGFDRQLLAGLQRLDPLQRRAPLRILALRASAAASTRMRDSNTGA